MLEISQDHLRKLEGNIDVPLDERATIYYTRPYDIMDNEDRSILINSLIRLNNFIQPLHMLQLTD